MKVFEVKMHGMSNGNVKSTFIDAIDLKYEA
jgi:hypothetical protein